MKRLDKIKSLTQELKKLIAIEPSVAEFNRLAKEVENSNELRQMEAQLKLHQQTMVQALSKNNHDLHSKTLVAYNQLEETYFNHPLYTNYMHYKEEVNDLMQEIIKVLSDL